MMTPYGLAWARDGSLLLCSSPDIIVVRDCDIVRNVPPWAIAWMRTDRGAHFYFPPYLCGGARILLDGEDRAYRDGCARQGRQYERVTLDRAVIPLSSHPLARVHCEAYRWAQSALPSSATAFPIPVGRAVAAPEKEPGHGP